MEEDAVARTDPLRDQLVGHAVGREVQLPIAQLPGVARDRGAVAVRVGPTSQRVSQCEAAPNPLAAIAISGLLRPTDDAL